MEGLLLWTITTVLALLYQSSSTNGQTCVSRYRPRLLLTAQTDVDISLLSPAFHNSNPSNFECVWTITAAKGYVVMVNFTKFTIVSPKDFSLKLFDSYADNLWRDKYLIGYYNLTGLPPDMFSSGTSMHLLFDRAKVAPEGQQFKLTYRAVKPRPDPTICSPFNKKTVNKNIILPTSADQGTFHSPLYPNPYPSNIECTWTIQIPSGTIELYFDDFRLEGDFNKGCPVSADTVQVNRTLLRTTAVPSPRYVGNTTVIPTVPSFIVNTLCGLSSPRVDLVSTTGYMSITFKSNLNNEVYFGFKATWKRIKDKPPTNVPNSDVCSADNTIEQNWNVRVSSSSGRGRITNPYQSKYQITWPYLVVACRWQIEVPEGSKIKLDFGEYSFSLRGRLGECYELDSVSIFDAGLANAGNGTKVKTLCGNFFRTADIQSTGRFITIVFKGDPSRYTNQFEIKWERVDEAADVGMIVGVVIGCVSLIVIVAVVTWYFVRRRREANKPGSPNSAESVPLET